MDEQDRELLLDEFEGWLEKVLRKYRPSMAQILGVIAAGISEVMKHVPAEDKVELGEQLILRIKRDIGIPDEY